MSNINFKQNSDGTFDLIAKINNRNKRIFTINKDKVIFDGIVEINKTIKVKDSKKGSGLIVPIKTSTETKTGSMFYDSAKDSLNVFTETTGSYKEIKTTEVDTSIDVTGGGTGLSSLATDNILVGSGTSTMTPKTLVAGSGTTITHNANDITIGSNVLDSSGNLEVSSGVIQTPMGTNIMMFTSGNTTIVGDLTVNGNDIILGTEAAGTISNANETTDDTSGHNLTIKASAGKGSGSGGDIIFQTAQAPGGATSSTQGVHSSVLTLFGNGNATFTGEVIADNTISLNNNILSFDGSHSSVTINPTTGTNAAGYRLLLEGGQGTGTAVGGSIYLRSTLAGGSGSTANSYTDIFGVHGTGHAALRATSKLLFDAANGSGHTYIQESSDDVLDIYVGGDKMIELSEAQSKISILENFKLYFDGAGEACYITSDSSNITIGADGEDKFFITDSETKSEQAVKIKEASNAASDSAGYGQIWVKSNTPNKLMFTDDAGADVSINGQFFVDCGWYQGSSAGRYMPLVSGQNEASSLIDFSNDDVFFIVPYNLKITTIYMNMVRTSNSAVHPGNTNIRLAKNGSFISNSVTVNVNDTGYDSTNLYNVYTWDFSSETNSYSAGDIMQIYFDPTNAVYYCSATVVGYYT
tara:strand:- start:1305 stop:3221 length:1917 start_codon:yes stop_codon:yes gene_type:complete